MRTKKFEVKVLLVINGDEKREDVYANNINDNNVKVVNEKLKKENASFHLFTIMNINITEEKRRG